MLDENFFFPFFLEQGTQVRDLRWWAGKRIHFPHKLKRGLEDLRLTRLLIHTLQSLLPPMHVLTMKLFGGERNKLLYDVEIDQTGPNSTQNI
jgi:hypothetical protein